MTTSFYNGVSGLKSFQSGIDIWGNNIANINTVGFKANKPEFSTIFAQTLKTSPINSDLGMGSTLFSTAIDLSQGSFIDTDNPFDIALGGEGWLAVKKGEYTYYTRNGAFTRDANGFLVDDSGNYLLVANANNLIKQDNGYIIDTNKETTNLITNNQTFTPISLPNNVILPAIPTSEVTLQTNLDNSDIITTTTAATLNSDFSALYSKDGQDLKIRNGDSLIFGFGANATYQNNLISTELCINDDIVDGKDVTYSFNLNGIDFNITLPDGSTKEEIINAIKTEFDNNGILNEVTSNGIKIYDTQKIILTSNNDLLSNIAVAKLTYRTEPQEEYEYSTIEEFNTILQNLANIVYPDATQVYLDNDGKISIDNNSSNIINSYILKTETSNEAFLNNLGNLGNEIYPNTSSKSYEFYNNTQSFGGNIIEANGNKDTISFTFTKQKVLDNQILWNGLIEIKDSNNEVITKQEETFIFDTTGNLVSPTTITLNSPQEITLNFNITSYNKTDLGSYMFSQNGIEEGYLKNYEIDDFGRINAFFSNSKMITLAQIPIFHFQNDQGLESLGGNLFRETSNSNNAILYSNENGEYISGAKILSQKLETSNVKFSEAMTELIITQKAFSSAAKTVTTSDQMIQKAIDMKQ